MNRQATTVIIKSMSRREPSFGQLIDYMTDVKKSEEKYFVYHNVFSQKPADLQAEFMANAKCVQRRKNGVYLYHEILSIKSPESLDKTTQKELLRDIAYDYAQQRANDCMVFGALHDDHDEHLHYHLCISANHCHSAKKHRMSKAEFDGFKKSLESQVLHQYPQLEQQITINRQAGEKLSQKGGEIKRRTGQTPQRDQLKAKLESIFAHTRDKQAFFTAMSAEGFEIYARGKTLGVRDIAAERNHRLKTLGLLDSFNALSARIELHAAEQAKASGAESGQSERQGNRSTEENQNNQNSRENRTDRVNLNARNNRANASTQNTGENQNDQSNRATENNEDNRFSQSSPADSAHQSAEKSEKRCNDQSSQKPAADATAKPSAEAERQAAIDAAYARHKAQLEEAKQRKDAEQQNENKAQSSQKNKPQQ